MPRKSKVATSNSVLTTVRIQKHLARAMDLLVKYGIFKTKTDLINYSLNRIVVEIFIALLALDEMDLQKYLSDPEQLKKMFEDPSLIMYAHTTEEIAIQAYTTNIFSILQRVPPQKISELVSALNDEFGAYIAQKRFKQLTPKLNHEENGEKSKPDEVSPDAPRAEDTPRQASESHLNGGDSAGGDPGSHSNGGDLP